MPRVVRHKQLDDLALNWELIILHGIKTAFWNSTSENANIEVQNTQNYNFTCCFPLGVKHGFSR